MGIFMPMTTPEMFPDMPFTLRGKSNVRRLTPDQHTRFAPFCKS